MNDGRRKGDGVTLLVYRVHRATVLDKKLRTVLHSSNGE